VQKSRSQFTLIEILVVVAIIGVLSMVVGTALLSRLQVAEEDLAAMEAGLPLTQRAPVAVAGEGYARPTLLSSDVRVDLSGEPVLDGYQMRTRYLARFSGTFRVLSEGPTLTLSFPFPPDTREIRDVSLSLVGEGGELYEPDGVRYSLDGVSLSRVVVPGEPITVVIDYTAAGRDAFVYDISGGDRTGDVSVTLTADGASQVVVPRDGLQPTERDGDTLSWRFGSLITTAPITVELPAGASPLGRSLALVRLSGVGVMLFGAGFWYMGQRRRYATMADFHLGHFLLLALNYSLFFAVLAALSYQLPLGVSLVAAALVSLPLLLLHIIRITDARFALRAAPLALITLSAPVAAAVAPQQRLLVVLGVAVLALGWLTVSWRSWWAAWSDREAAERTARETQQALYSDEARHREATEQAEAALSALRQTAEVAEGALVAAHLALEECQRAGALQEPVSRAIERLERVLRESERARAGLAEPEGALSERADFQDSLRVERERARPLIERRLARLVATTAALEAAEAAAPRAGPVEERHCPACGHGLSADAGFCGGCGEPRPASVGCDSCGDATVLPAHLLRGKWRDAALHCGGCGAGLR